MMKVVVLLVYGLIFYWLLSVICHTWHLPFWGIFWVLTIFEVGQEIEGFINKETK